MPDERNQAQIIRKDARNCFVESLSDAFPLSKAHFAFAAYDLSKPAGHRQTSHIHIYISVSELLEFCRKLTGGEMRWVVQDKKKNNDATPIQEWLGGTSAEKLKRYGKARPDGKSLSRTCKLVCGARTDFILVADSGPGDQTDKGLIVPRFGNHPENHVAVSMSWDSLSEMLLMTKMHYEAWLTAWYMRQPQQSAQNLSPGAAENPTAQAGIMDANRNCLF